MQITQFLCIVNDCIVLYLMQITIGTVSEVKCEGKNETYLSCYVLETTEVSIGHSYSLIYAMKECRLCSYALI